MATRTPNPLGTKPPAGFEGIPIFDCDVHHSSGGRVLEYLPERWREYIKETGRRGYVGWGATTTQRYAALRVDAHPPGGMAGTDPDFARQQLLEPYGISAAILENTTEGMVGGYAPTELEIEMIRAVNDVTHDVWFEADPRWLASINIPADHIAAAVDEIVRCRERSDRFVQILINSRTERPQGNPKYWPIYEAAAHYGLPVAFHVGLSQYNHQTGVGPITYYYEFHVEFPLPAQAMVPSMIFEGVFDRFPALKIVPTELGWEWAVPFAWRLDSTWRVLRNEVSHLERKPSEYFRDHFWFTTQPLVEPEDPAQFYALYDQFVEYGFADRLMFSSDYPHWDMDSPYDSTPAFLSPEDKRKILGANAAALHGIELPTPTTAA
jgi:uncharacterized protein